MLRKEKELFFFFKTINQALLNYEEQNQYKIRIRFSNDSEFIEKDFLIYIEDVNESPYNLQCFSRDFTYLKKIRRKYYLFR